MNPRRSEQVSRSVPSGAKLESLPPPAELAELDLGWGDSAEERGVPPSSPSDSEPERPRGNGERDARALDLSRLTAFHDDRRAGLETELLAWRTAAEAATARVAHLEAELAARSAALTVAERRIGELVVAFDAAGASVGEAVAAARAEDAARLALADRTIAELGAELAAVRSGPRANAPVGTKGDDLQAIRGIGPKLATKLTSLGITSYQQLAALGPNDLASLAELLGVHLKRIERDGWVESARALAEQGGAAAVAVGGPATGPETPPM